MIGPESGFAMLLTKAKNPKTSVDLFTNNEIETNLMKLGK